MTDPTPTTPLAGVYRCAECEAIWRTEAQRDLCCTARQDSTTPRAIAGRLTPMQRKALVWCDSGHHHGYVLRSSGFAPHLRAMEKMEPALTHHMFRSLRWHLTEAGHAVRAEIEREAGR